MTQAPDTGWPAYLVFAWLPVVAGALLWLFVRSVRRGALKTPALRLALGNLLVFLFLGAVAFLGLETWFRFFRDTTDSFNHTLTSRRWFTRHYHVNNLGVRDNITYEMRIAPGKRRITFLGDSFAVGHGVANVDDRFANVIRHAAPEVEVHVLARPGFDTALEIGLIEHMASLGYQFDTVILAYCLNDIGDLLPEWSRALERVNVDWRDEGWLAANSYFINTLACRLEARRDPALRGYFDFVKEAYRGEPWQELQRRLAMLRDLVQAKGGRLLVVTFPFFHALGPGYEWKPVHDQLDAFWRELGVPHLDLLAVYEGRSAAELTVNRFDAHPNELAHMMAAEAILRFLSRQRDAGQSTANESAPP